MSTFLVAAVLSVVVSIAPAQANTSGAAVASLNELRAANGIPPVTEDAVLSAGCAEWANYAALNGGWDPGAPHGETPGKPGYTSAGDVAAQHSVLAAGGWSNPSPWWDAPFHLEGILNPKLATTGYGENGRFACMQASQSPARTLEDGKFFSFPGNGTTGVRTSETADELNAQEQHLVPGDWAGLPHGTTTGPYIMVWPPSSPLSTAPGLVAFSLASMSTSAGVAVDTRAISNFIIPVHPLEPATTYSVHVEATLPMSACRLPGTPDEFMDPFAAAYPGILNLVQGWPEGFRDCPAGAPQFCWQGPIKPPTGFVPASCTPNPNNVIWMQSVVGLQPAHTGSYDFSFTTAAADAVVEQPSVGSTRKPTRHSSLRCVAAKRNVSAAARAIRKFKRLPRRQQLASAARLRRLQTRLRRAQRSQRLTCSN